MKHIRRLPTTALLWRIAGCLRQLPFLLVGLCLLAIGPHAFAQPEKEPPLPDPKTVELLTKDGVKLSATYSASDRGRETVPLILLHGFKGSRSDYDEFARFLQREHHHAVLTVDLRGHGESTHQSFGSEQRTLSAERLRPEDFEAMVQFDVEESKRFLMREHHAGKLNIERLGLIGAGMGATIATYWSFNDWAAPRLAIKQGQDVRALVLISPETRFKAFNIVEPFTSPELRSEVALYLIAAGAHSKAGKAAEQIYNTVKRYHPLPAEDLPADKALAAKTLFLDTNYETTLQGTKLLGEKLGVEERIAKFIELRLAKPSIPWAERRSAIP